MIQTFFAVLSLFLTSLSGAQSTQPSAPPDSQKIDAEKILKAVDDRIYYAKEHGLKSFRFRLSMDRGKGEFQKPLKGLFMAVSWRAPNTWRTDLVDKDGHHVSNLPAFFETKNGRTILSAFQTELKGMALHLIVGLPLHKKFSKHIKKVKKSKVNNKIEYRITMHPDRKRSYSEAILKIVDGLPRELIHVSAKGQRYISRFRYAKRKKLGDKWLWVGVDQEAQNRRTRLESYEYLTRDGLLILSVLKRHDYVSIDTPRVDFKIEGLEVNPTFPSGFFASEKAKK